MLKKLILVSLLLSQISILNAFEGTQSNTEIPAADITASSKATSSSEGSDASKEMAQMQLMEDAAVYLEEGISSVQLQVIFDQVQETSNKTGVEAPTKSEIAESILN